MLQVQGDTDAGHQSVESALSRMISEGNEYIRIFSFTIFRSRVPDLYRGWGVVEGAGDGGSLPRYIFTFSSIIILDLYISRFVD